MKINKEQFRNFEKDLLVYQQHAPKIDYTAFKEMKEADQKIKERADKEELKKGTEFTDKKAEALKKLDDIHLDTKFDEMSPAEKQLKARLAKYIKAQFDLLEHNYQERVKVVGRGPENVDAKKARLALDNAAGDFVYRMEMYVLKESIRSADKKGALAAQIRMIDGFTGVEGFGRHLIEGGGLTKADLSTIFARPLPASRKEFYERLKSVLDNEGKLELGIKNMIRKSPKFTEVNEENDKWNKKKELFTNMVNLSITEAETSKNPKKSFTYMLGTKHKDKLATTLARRFDVKYIKGTNKVEHFVDLMYANKVYKPNEIMGHLRYISHNELRSPKHMEVYNKRIDKAQETQADLHKELVKGIWYRTDKEVTGLSTLRNNPKLQRLIAKADNYEGEVNKSFKEINQYLARFKQLPASAAARTSGIQPEIRKVASLLTEEKVKSSPVLSNGKALAEIFKLIQSLIKGKDAKTMKQVAEDLNNGENPAEKIKKAKELYAEILKKAKPQPSLDKLLAFYQNPDDAKTFFGTYALKKGTDAMSAVVDYPKERLPAIKSHLQKQLGVTGLNVTTEGDKLKFAFLVGEQPKIFLVKRVEGNKFEVANFLDPSKTNTVPRTFAALANELKPKPASTPATKKEVVAKKAETVKQKTLYEKAIRDSIETSFKRKTSLLGELVKFVKGKKLPSWRMTKGKDRNDRQSKLDKARAKMLTENLTPELMKEMAKNPEFKKKLDHWQKRLAQKEGKGTA